MSVPHDPILQYFAWEHLPEELQRISRPFGELARFVEQNCPRNPERSVAFRKLLESKDAAVRARLDKSDPMAQAERAIADDIAAAAAASKP